MKHQTGAPLSSSYAADRCCLWEYFRETASDCPNQLWVWCIAHRYDDENLCYIVWSHYKQKLHKYRCLTGPVIQTSEANVMKKLENIHSIYIYTVYIYPDHLDKFHIFWRLQRMQASVYPHMGKKALQINHEHFCITIKIAHGCITASFNIFVTHSEVP